MKRAFLRAVTINSDDDTALAQAASLMREIPLKIADSQVGYCGTVGGNVANGDRANDMLGLCNFWTRLSSLRDQTERAK